MRSGGRRISTRQDSPTIRVTDAERRGLPGAARAAFACGLVVSRRVLRRTRSGVVVMVPPPRIRCVFGTQVA